MLVNRHNFGYKETEVLQRILNPRIRSQQFNSDQKQNDYDKKTGCVFLFDLLLEFRLFDFLYNLLILLLHIESLFDLVHEVSLKDLHDPKNSQVPDYVHDGDDFACLVVRLSVGVNDQV